MRDERSGHGPRTGSASGATEIAALLDAAAGHYGAGRIEAAAALYRQAESRDPNDIRAVYSLAVIDLRQGRFADARRRLKAVLRRDSSHFGALHNLGVAEQNLGGWPAARAAYQRALALRSNATETAFNLAIAQAVLGRIDDAIATYRALAADPATRSRALTRLAVLRPEAITDAELTDLRAAATTVGAGGEAKIGLLFALAGALEARGEDGPAWDAYQAANALKHQRLADGPHETRPATVARVHAQSIARIQALFTPDFLAAHANEGDNTSQPIFILGMPRSGSSLIEQILASHPQVQGLGESSALSEVIEGRYPYPPHAPLEPRHFRRLARDYLRVQTARGWNGRARLTDKTLDNHLHVGLIHLMFPRAIILMARRDPVDVGVACYRQLFARGNETLYDLGDIAAEIRRYDAIMAHWRAVLPGRVFEVSYERLVAEPEPQIRRLVTEGCALPWAASCLAFHEKDRSVITASAEQVRRPIFRSSVDRWRRYEGRLGPLLTGLGDQGERVFISRKLL